MKNLTTSALQTAGVIAVSSLLAAPLAACSAASSALPIPGPTGETVPGQAAPPAHFTTFAAARDAKSKTPLLYIGDNANEVLVYDASTTVQNPQPLGAITDGISGPLGMTTDRSGNLYVANSSNNSVTVYAPNSSAPKATITNGVTNPVDVRVDGFGNLYVANNASDAASYINEYPPGASQASYTWTAPAADVHITGIALVNPLQKGMMSIYALANVANPSGAYGELLECQPANASCSALSGYSFGHTAGIMVAQSPNKHPLRKPFVFFAADESLPGIDKFTDGKLTGQQQIYAVPTFMAQNSKRTAFFASEYETGDVVEYGDLGQVINTFAPSNNEATGVATYPAGTYF